MPKRKVSQCSSPRTSKTSKNRRKKKNKNKKKKPRKDININITLDLNEVVSQSNLECASNDFQSEFDALSCVNATERNSSIASMTPKTPKKESNNRKRKKMKESLKKNETFCDSNVKKFKNSGKVKNDKIVEKKDESVSKFPSMNLFKNIFKTEKKSTKKEKNEKASKPMDNSNKTSDQLKSENLQTINLTSSNANEVHGKPITKEVTNTSSQCVSRPVVSTETITPAKNTLDTSKCSVIKSANPSNSNVKSSVNNLSSKSEKSFNCELSKQKPQVINNISENSKNKICDKNSKCLTVSLVNKCTDGCGQSLNSIKSNNGSVITSENTKGETSNNTTDNTDTCINGKKVFNIDRETPKNDSSVESKVAKTCVNVSKSYDSSLQLKSKINSSKTPINDTDNSVKPQFINEVKENKTVVSDCSVCPINTNDKGEKVTNNTSCSEKNKSAVDITSKCNSINNHKGYDSTNICKNECKSNRENCSTNSGGKSTIGSSETKIHENECKNNCETGCTNKHTNSSSEEIKKTATCGENVSSPNHCKTECPKGYGKGFAENTPNSVGSEEKTISEFGFKNDSKKSHISVADKVNNYIKPCEKKDNSNESLKTNSASCVIKDSGGKVCISEDIKPTNQSGKCTSEYDKKEKENSLKTNPETKTQNICNRKENQSVFLETDCQSVSEKSQKGCYGKSENGTNSTATDRCMCLKTDLNVKANQSVFIETCQVCCRNKSASGTHKISDKGLENKNLFGTPKTKIEKDNESVDQ